MILEQLKETENFTSSERMIAKYVLEHAEHLTASDLAKESYTSKTTVIRLCKKRVNALLESEPFNENSTYEDIVQKLPSIYDSAVGNTKLSLDRNVVRRVVNRIRQADKVDFYGNVNRLE